MQSDEAMTDHLEKAKQVRFLAGTKEYDDIHAKKLHVTTVKERWLECCYKGEYIALKRELSEFEERGVSIQKLFSREGDVILGWAVETARTIEPLQFIYENVEKNYIQPVLGRANYSILEGLILGETGLDKYQYVSEEALEIRRKKFTYLLYIDPEGVQDFMYEHSEEPWVGIQVKMSFNDALAAYQTINKIDFGV
jgi:hypothetical protein